MPFRFQPVSLEGKPNLLKDVLCYSIFFLPSATSYWQPGAGRWSLTQRFDYHHSEASLAEVYGIVTVSFAVTVPPSAFWASA